MRLKENIRELRRERGLTQEQLAEAMGVSTAAVSKWESGTSTPEVTMLAALADYFEVSIDRLLDYQVQTHREEDDIRRIQALAIGHRYREATEAAQALLRRYPNSFEAVVAALKAHLFLGMQEQDESSLRMGLILADRALALLHQTKKPSLCQEDLLDIKGQLYDALHDYKQAIAYFEQVNFNHEKDIPLGNCYVALKQFEEALPLLSDGLIRCVMSCFNASFSMGTCLMALNRPKDAKALIDWCLNLLEGLDATPSSYVWKMRAMLQLGLAEIAWDTHQPGEAEEAIRQAVACALRFDRTPDYRLNSIRFYDGAKYAVADSLGESTMEGLRRTLDEAENNQYQALRLILDRAEEEAHGQDPA